MARNLSNLLSFFIHRGERQAREHEATEARERCLACDSYIAEEQLYLTYRICPKCRFHYALAARERIGLLADEGSFKETNRSLISLDPLSFSSRIAYKEHLRKDRRRTGLTEAVVTGTCSIGGTPAALVVMDFGFMGGSMGSVVGEKVALALEMASKKKLPVVAVVTSGGSRVQEGILSLMQMAKTSMAVNKLAEKRAPLISVLANPATGQMYASFANLADIILSEPGALVGLASLRAIAESSQEPLPPDAHTAEFHLRHGHIDKIVDREHLKDMLATLLDLVGTRYALTVKGKGPKSQAEIQRSNAWESVQLARHEDRPSAGEFVVRMFSNFVELHGDRVYGDDESLICGVGYLGGQSVAVIGQNGRNHPEGFRKARRTMKLAARFDMPLVTLIDTPGPHLSLQSEEKALGNAIATAMATMAGLPVPTIAAIIGEGGSEGALALGIADRVLMLEHAIYSSVSPESAASLFYRDEAKAPEMAESLKLTAADCKELDIVDRLVREPRHGAHSNPNESARYLRRALLQELAQLQSTSAKRLVRQRYKKFRKMGEYSSHFRAAVSSEVSQLQSHVLHGVRSIRRRRDPEGPESSDSLKESRG